MSCFFTILYISKWDELRSWWAYLHAKIAAPLPNYAFFNIKPIVKQNLNPFKLIFVKDFNAKKRAIVKKAVDFTVHVLECGLSNGKIKWRIFTVWGEGKTEFLKIETNNDYNFTWKRNETWGEEKRS